jgi:GNAT superfamily N-acetyltransferase
VTIRPLTPSRWKDLETLFGARGACGGCWCMFWRLPRAEFERRKGDGNRRAFRKLVKEGSPPGLLAYDGRQPVGWCAVAPRAVYPALARSRILRPPDGEPVWSVSCLFVARPYRRRGLSKLLLEAAADHVRRRGGRIVEGYPVEAKTKTADAFVWTGLASAFVRAGFTEVARRSPTRPIMRRRLR